MSGKPILMRPVEVVTGTNDTIKVQAGSGGAYTSITIDPGVYASVFGVIWEFQATLTTSGFANTWTIEDGADTDGRYLYNKIVFGSDHTILIDQEDTARMLGWGYNTSTGDTATTHSFDYQPDYCWTPRHQVTNQNRFTRRLGNEFAGKMVKTGSLAGNSTGPTLNYRMLEFQNEKPFNLVDEGATTELYYDGSQTTKNLQYFTHKAMASFPSVAGNPSTRGVWFAQDWNEILGTVSASKQGPCTRTSPIDRTDEIGIRFDLDTDADRWAFCQLDPSAIPPPDDLAVPTGRTLYNQANIMLHTATYPVFFATNPGPE